MTTETAGTPAPGTRPLVGAAGAALAVGLLVSVLGAVTHGSAAAYAALVGTGFVVAIFAFGSFAVHVVATLMPAASLLFAMVTYTLQVVLMALVFAALNRSGALDETLDREWLGGAIIAGAACWLVVQVVVATRVRIPVYDLPESAAQQASDPTSSTRTEATQR